jgi:TonB family protein
MFRRVSITHGAVILLTILLPFLPRCTPKPKKIVTFFDLAGSPAPAPELEPEPEDTPEIEVKSEPKPKPKPKPEKKPSIKPAITNTPPKKVETNTPPKKAESKKPAVTNTPPKKAVTNAPAKPKTEKERIDAARHGKPVPAPGAKSSAPTRKPVDYNALRNALNNAAKGSGSGTSASGSGSGAGGMYSPFAWYYDSVKQRMYSVWQQPSGTPIGLSAEASIRVESDGRVSSKFITRRSGNAQFDQSVQTALNATTSLPVPPPDLPRDIQIVFEVGD